MNETYFKPHGLFCMIVVYKPEEPQYFDETYDVNTGAMKNRGTPVPTQTRTGRFRLASTETKGETEMPQPAPLIFPQLEKWAEQGGTPYKSETAGFLRDYFDRRAQATFVRSLLPHVTTPTRHCRSSLSRNSLTFLDDRRMKIPTL